MVLEERQNGFGRGLGSDCGSMKVGSAPVPCVHTIISNSNLYNPIYTIHKSISFRTQGVLVLLVEAVVVVKDEFNSLHCLAMYYTNDEILGGSS